MDHEFKSKNNDRLVSELKELARKEREITTRIIRYLLEIESRKVHLEMRYPDIYAFAEKELGYSRGAAHRRISAMRLIKVLPEVEAQVENGGLSLTNAVQVQSYFKHEDKKRKERGEGKLSTEMKREVVQSVLGTSTRECEWKIAERSPDEAPPLEKTRALQNGKTLIQFVASPELMKKLERLKEHLAHQNFDGRYDVLIEILADHELQKLEPKPPKTPAPGVKRWAEPKQRSRYIPRAIERAVKQRDQNQCTYRDPKTGKICGNRHGVQLDHYPIPFSRGGASTIENLTVRCGPHNRYLAEKMGLGARPGSG